ncbi:hypothetical protein AB1Y20_006687 [Prymnesium parvum]|uniref:EF-hand domain-containing protein n=1 Tax=Prymnesium parvum TaxID=97485 RepID=A0AB34IZJ7_PRYPA
MAAPEADACRPARRVIQTRRQHRPVTNDLRRFMDMMWRSDIKRWLESVGRDATTFKGMSPRDEQEIKAWFNALDMDQSGSVEEDEIKALMDAMGVACSRSMLVELFGSIGKDVTAELTLPEFLRLMIVNAVRLTGASTSTGMPGEGSGLFDANTRLMMLAYRRQRLLEDIADPSKRRNFVSAQSFAEAYGAPEASATETYRGSPRNRFGVNGYGSRGRPSSSFAVSPRIEEDSSRLGKYCNPPVTALPALITPRPTITGKVNTSSSPRGMASGAHRKSTYPGEGRMPSPPKTAPSIGHASIPSWDRRPQPPSCGARVRSPEKRYCKHAAK